MPINIKYEGAKNYALPLLREGVKTVELVVADLHRRGDINDGQRIEFERLLTDGLRGLFGDAAKIACVRDWTTKEAAPAAPTTPELTPPTPPEFPSVS